MSYSSSLITELEEACNSYGSEKRVETLRRITALFLGESNRLNEHQIKVFDDVLIHLIQRIETRALAQLSTSLAPVDNAPVETIRRLSRHDEISVAGVVLAQSNRLSEQDLVDIAQSKGQEHLLAMSGRSSIQEAVTNVLVERGNTLVHHELASNSGARFSRHAYANLVKKSESDDKLAEKLGRRLDMPQQLLCQLLTRATDQVRSRLLTTVPPENRDKMQHALAHVANEVARETTGPRDFAVADILVYELNRLGKLNEPALVEFAKAGKYEEMIATLALFSVAKSDLIGRILKNISSDGIIIVCKAAHLSWPTTRLILQTRFAPHSPSERELDDAKDAFLELSRASAQRSMRFMQVQEAAKKTG